MIVRQRPDTAKDFIFITLEDETGVSNLIVTPDRFRQNRPLLRGGVILCAEGVLQRPTAQPRRAPASASSRLPAGCRPRAISTKLRAAFLRFIAGNGV